MQPPQCRGKDKRGKTNKKFQFLRSVEKRVDCQADACDKYKRGERHSLDRLNRWRGKNVTSIKRAEQKYLPCGKLYQERVKNLSRFASIHCMRERKNLYRRACGQKAAEQNRPSRSPNGPEDYSKWQQKNGEGARDRNKRDGDHVEDSPSCCFGSGRNQDGKRKSG